MYLSFIYGSLREEFHNRVGRKMTRKDNFLLQGFKMYSLTFFPAVIYTGKTEDYIFVELTDIETEKEMQSIDILESMYQKTILQFEGMERQVIIYTLQDSDLKRKVEVENGDWKYFKLDRADEYKKELTLNDYEVVSINSRLEK